MKIKSYGKKYTSYRRNQYDEEKGSEDSTEFRRSADIRWFVVARGLGA